ncbi:hypothetical protein GCM10027347_40790 [Larkinella harenae]
MNPLFLQRTSRLLVKVVMVLTLFNSSVLAQSDYYARVDSNRAYWKIQTDATNQKTLIRFFNRWHEPIYQEILPGRYVKLTNRNVRVFDEILDRLTNQQLVSAEVKSYALSSANAEVIYPAPSLPLPGAVITTYLLDESGASAEFNPLRSDVSISDAGKLKLHVLNSLQKPLLITLMDEQGRYVYKEKAALLNYSRTLNLTRLHEGRFTLEVAGDKKDYRYRLLIQGEPRTYQLRAMR